MLCRVRKKDDDLKSGVGAQRGTGMHINWIKAQKQSRPDLERQPSEPLSPTVNEVPPDEEFARRRESIVDANAAKAREKEEAKAAEENADEEARRHKSTASYASTNSSFLARNFPQRIFILKSNTIVSVTTGFEDPLTKSYQTELEESKRSGTWRTQKHNEPILGMFTVYRNSRIILTTTRPSLPDIARGVLDFRSQQVGPVLRVRQNGRAY
jgi:hypothetical protein